MAKTMATVTGSKSDVKAYNKALRILAKLEAEKTRLQAELRSTVDLLIETALMSHRWNFMDLSIRYKDLINEIKAQQRQIEYLSKHLKISS